MNRPVSASSTASSTSTSSTSVVLDLQQIHLLHDGDLRLTSTAALPPPSTAKDSFVTELLRQLQSHQQDQQQGPQQFFVKPLLADRCYELNRFLPPSLCRQLLRHCLALAKEHNRDDNSNSTTHAHAHAHAHAPSKADSREKRMMSGNGGRAPLKRSPSAKGVLRMKKDFSSFSSSSGMSLGRLSSWGRRRSNSSTSISSASTPPSSSSANGGGSHGNGNGNASGSVTPRSKRYLADLFSGLSLKRTKSVSGIETPSSSSATASSSDALRIYPAKRSASEQRLTIPKGFDGGSSSVRHAKPEARKPACYSVRYLYPLNTIQVEKSRPYAPPSTALSSPTSPRNNKAVISQLDSLLDEAINSVFVPILEFCPLGNVGNITSENKVSIRRAYLWQKRCRGRDISTAQVVHDTSPSVKDKLLALRKKDTSIEREQNDAGRSADCDVQSKRKFIANICLGSLKDAYGKRAIGEVIYQPTSKDSQHMKSVQTAGSCVVYDADSVKVLYPDNPSEWLYQCILELEVVNHDHSSQNETAKEDARCCIS